MAIDWDALVLGPCMDIFGEAIVYTTADTGASFSMSGVFDRAYVEVKFDESGVAISTLKPALGVQQSSFPAGVTAAQGDTVLINGVLYLVTDTQPDGHGHIFLMMKLKR